MLLLPVVLFCSALSPMAVLLFPVVLVSSALSPTCRVEASGGVDLQRTGSKAALDFRWCWPGAP